MLTESLQQLLVWPNENWRSGASDHQKKYEPKKKNKKNPRGIRPCRYSPSPQVTKYAMVTQDMSPRGKAEICDTRFVWPHENRRSGASDQEKKI